MDSTNQIFGTPSINSANATTGSTYNRPALSLSTIVIAAVVCVASQVALMYLGAAVGLSAFNVGDDAAKGISIGAGIYTMLSLVVSFFIAGFIATRASGSRDKPTALYNGVGTWAFASLAFVFMLGTSAMSTMHTVADTAAPAVARHSDATADQLRTNPETRAETRAEVRHAAEDTRKAGAGTFAFLFISSIVSLLATFWGANVARGDTAHLFGSHSQKTPNRRHSAA
jgi:hypothetical protein